MYSFQRKDRFTLNSGFYRVDSGFIIIQKPLPSGSYSNVSILSMGNFYESKQEIDDYTSVLALTDATLVKVDISDVSVKKISEQLSEQTQLTYFQSLPIQNTRQKIYMFLRWAENKGVLDLLTQELVAGFCGVERLTIQRHFNEMRRLKLINI